MTPTNRSNQRATACGFCALLSPSLSAERSRFNAYFFVSFLVLCSSSGLACSFNQPVPVSFQKSLARPGDQPPASPQITVQSITRGNADDARDSCSDTGVVVLEIPATAESRKLAYSFEMVSGTADDVIFQPGPSEGYEKDGKLLFYFPWLDGAAKKQEPLNLVVRVTPYRMSGLSGKPNEVKIVDNGR